MKWQRTGRQDVALGDGSPAMTQVGNIDFSATA
jgi:hypothetical protein